MFYNITCYRLKLSAVAIIMSLINVINLQTFLNYKSSAPWNVSNLGDPSFLKSSK